MKDFKHTAFTLRYKETEDLMFRKEFFSTFDKDTMSNHLKDLLSFEFMRGRPVVTIRTEDTYRVYNEIGMLLGTAEKK